MKETSCCHCQLCKGDDCLCKPYADFYSVLSNTNRMHIIKALRKGDQNVSQIIELTNLEQTCVSHCLKLMEENSFVSSRREGKFKIYALNKETIEPLLKLIDKHVKKHQK